MKRVVCGVSALMVWGEGLSEVCAVHYSRACMLMLVVGCVVMIECAVREGEKKKTSKRVSLRR